MIPVKITPRKLTEAEMDQIVDFVISDSEIENRNTVLEAFQTATTLAYDMPSNDTYVMSILFLDVDNPNGGLDKIIDEFLITKDGVVSASDFDYV
jgi:hypothetical protein